MKWILALLIPVILVSGCRGSTRDPLHVTFCDVVGRPTSYEGVLVSFHAHIESNGMDRSELSSPACSNQGLRFNVTDASGSLAPVARIMLSQGMPGTLDKVVEADFSGELHWHLAHPHWIFYLKSVQNVSYRMIGAPTKK